MKYDIVSDKHGRIRVRCGNYAFSKEQGFALVEQITALWYVDSVEASSCTGSVLVYYTPGHRKELLKHISDIVMGELRLSENNQLALSSEVDAKFRRDVIGLVARRLFEYYILPNPITNVICMIRSVKYIRCAWRSLRKGKIGVEVLDGTAVGASLLQGNFTTASNIMFLLRLSDLLENYTHEKTKHALTESLIINVDNVWLDRDGTEVSIPLANLKIGDRIVVRTGSLIPVDGTVTDGEALVNQSAMTGEPMAVLKKAGSTVFAGTALEEGSIIIEVKALKNETRISQIVDLIQDSESLKASIQGKAERIADRIVPFSFYLAGAVFLFTGNLTKAVSVLLVDYSCAIKLSTPICVISAMKEAANHKIMVKGGKYLEAFAEADTIVFDKTGTLTAATPQVSKVIPFKGFERDMVLRISACLEEHFPHSVARAIVKRAKEEKLAHEEMHTEVEYIVAHGIVTTIEGMRAIIGSQHFVFEDEGAYLRDDDRRMVEEELGGDTAVYLAVNGVAAGCICISDPIRPEAAGVIRQLKALGIEDTVMLTGDSKVTARNVSRVLGIDSFRAQILPEDKAAIVEELKAQGRKIIMIGDGINDSPALAAAHVSVSMKDSSDIAREVSDVVLMTSDLSELVTLRKISSKLMTRINGNYLFIVGFNTSLLALSLAGTITPSISAVLHNGSTMAICASSMRRYVKKKDEVKIDLQTDIFFDAPSEEVAADTETDAEPEAVQAEILEPQTGAESETGERETAAATEAEPDINAGLESGEE